LNTLPIEIPPLRERKEDIMILFDSINNKLGSKFIISPQVKDVFMSHEWRGNVRELHNYVEYLSHLDLDYIDIDDIPSTFHKRLSSVNNEIAEKDFDVSLLKKIAKNKLDDYLYVLEMLYDSYINKKNLGRLSIAEEAQNTGRYLTQQEVRSILYDLNNLGFIKISKGRGGSKINDRGIKVYKELIG